MPDSPADLGPVLVTGASGFIGSAVVRALLDRGAQVRALVEPGRDDENLAGLSVDRVVCDIRESSTVDEAVDGVSTVFHLAALYRFWAADPNLFYDVNVGGTMNILRAAAREKCRRFVYTSTVATLGVAEAGSPASEQSLVHFEHLFGHYKRSKYLAEHEVLRAGAGGLPVVLVHPTFPVGEGDSAPTPTGRTIVEFLNGRIPAYVDTALNVVHVDDVARGHVLAAESGRAGQSYILGGENLTYREAWRRVARIVGRRGPLGTAPAAGTWLVGQATAVWGWLSGEEPVVNPVTVAMGELPHYFDSARARSELDFPETNFELAVSDAWRWFKEHGYVR